MISIIKGMTLIISNLLIQTTLQAQISTPVKWRYAAKKINTKEAVIFIKAAIDDGWHIYSIHQKEGGPVKTSFAFDPSKDYTLSDKIVEPKPITKFEKTFGIDVTYFKKEVVFQQKVRLKTSRTTIKGKLKYMVCNDQKCLPPEDVEFSIPIE